jgi:hypothetical protein
MAVQDDYRAIRDRYYGAAICSTLGAEDIKTINPNAFLILGIIFCAEIRGSEPSAAFEMTTKGPHPLAETIWAIQSKYTWLINYEEPPVVASDELIVKVAPTGRTILIRRMKPISTVLSTEDVSAGSPERQLTIVNEILEAYEKSGASDSFRATLQGRFIDIAPVSFRGEGGGTQAFDPILSTRISFPETHFPNMYSLVAQVIEQISSKRSVPITIGEIPNNLLREPVVESAENEPARDVLARAFWGINGPRLARGQEMAAVTWTLLYDPESRGYWFSTNAVTVKNTDDATAPAKTWPTPLPGDSSDPPSRRKAILLQRPSKSRRSARGAYGWSISPCA